MKGTASCMAGSDPSFNGTSGVPSPDSPTHGALIMTGAVPESRPLAVTADAQVAKVFGWRRGFNAMHLLGIQKELPQSLPDVPLEMPIGHHLQIIVFS